MSNFNKPTKNIGHLKQTAYQEAYQSYYRALHKKEPPKSKSSGTLTSLLLVGLLSFLIYVGYNNRYLFLQQVAHSPPLAMTGGDPYIRALMRTISASESRDSSPYTLLYGGGHAQDLSRHPNQCIVIVTGPNQGNCTTAAGRYQILNTTWAEKVQKYSPNNSPTVPASAHSFQPQAQDEVIYAWLRDNQAWGVDIANLLAEGKLDQVMRLLSGTWTSLGYGIEDNSMTPFLPKIYQQILKEELAHARGVGSGQ